MTVAIDYQNATEVTDLPPKKEFRRWTEMALAGYRQHAELTIRLVDESESRRLNREFRGQDKPTNVLSFPVDIPIIVGSDLLGDLVICAPVVQREAAAQGKSERAHWAHMVVHGVLHLLGLDHRTDLEAAAMERVEAATLLKLGFSDPYLDNSAL
ncbi:MAG: rRNA maturation RNase YbeY [Gammaproteobacteria bacterium]|nr:rRNA maturation RNase YbeY [Gammaproteobacteria bacterium]MCB1879515.1 rRNA maturation RNase YbeY [Gammaproteobacteria bacterium]